MRPFFIAAGIFLVIIAGITAHSLFLGHITGEMLATLSQLKLSAGAGDTDGALCSCESLQALIEKNYRYLDITVDHSDVDSLRRSARKVSVLLTLDEDDELMVEIDLLFTQISHLRDIESVTLLNIL